MALDLIGIAAIIASTTAPLAAVLAYRSEQASKRNALDIAKTNVIVAETNLTAQKTEQKIDGRLTKLIELLEANNILEKDKSFTDGAAAQREAPRGVAIIAPPPPPQAEVAPASVAALAENTEAIKKSTSVIEAAANLEKPP